MSTQLEIIPFQHETFGELRVAGDGDSPMFVASDVCRSLEIKNPSDALKRLDGDEKGLVSIYTPGGKQDVRAVTFPGLLSLVLGSRKPEAREYKRWVTHEVLPSIHKHGGYLTPAAAEKIISDPDTFIRVLTEMKEQRERADRLAAENAEMKPKALFADAVAASDGTCLVGELAKMLTQAGYKIGQNRLFEKLRQEGYLGTTGSHRNVPKQRYVEMGLFRIKETAITHGDGHVTLARTTKITGKGQRYFLEKYARVA